MTDTSSLLLSKITSEYGWVPRRRNYEEENTTSKKTGQEVGEGPLTEEKEKEKEENTSTPIASIARPLDEVEDDPLQNYDPLAADNPLNVEINPVYDPLSQACIEVETTPNLYKNCDEDFVPWKARKPGILKKYTTNERVSISVSFMENEATSGPVDKIKDRLEELEEAERGQESTVKVSQQEFLDQIESMHEDLLNAWNDNQRVQALKIAIQCSKLLCDTTVIKFYPSKFILITEILDTFGRLVFDRLRGRSVIYNSINAVPVPLPEDFKAEDVTPAARETCRNWFYKIASIRELLPRIYVEMALMNCYRFLSNDGFVPIVKRIGMMLNGLGNPLISTYARAYLARKGREVGCYQTDYLLSMFFAHIDTFIGLKKETAPNGNSRIEVFAAKSDMPMPEYLDLYTPALEWLLQCIGHNATQELLDVILKKYKETDNALVLDHILASFQPSFISPRALDFAALIREANDTYFPKYKLYRTLGENLVLCAPPESLRRKILNEIWSVVTKFEDPVHYMNVVEVFIEFPCKHCTLNELNIMLGDVLKHVKENHAYSNFQEELQNVIVKILNNQKEFTRIFNMENFMPIVDLLYGEKQVRVNRAILESFCSDTSPTTDPVLINAMFEVGKIVHDSINSMSFEDEIRQIADLLAVFIKKINYGLDLEKQLNFYVDCRRAFGNLDAVKQSLVIVAVGLSMKTHQVVKGKHTKRTAAFVRACIAFCFITIPSMDLVFPRLYLYLLTGQAALINQCIPQSEALFEAMISLVEEVPEYLELNNQVVSCSEQLLNFVSSLSSELIVVPGHPREGPLFLVKALLQVFEDRNWERETITRSLINLKLISMLCAMVQDKLPFHIPKIESNDVLYVGDPAYQQEVQDVIDALIKVILDNMQELQQSSDASSNKLRAELGKELFNYTITYSQLNEKSCAFALKMYGIAKSNPSNNVPLQNSLKYLSSRPDDTNSEGVSFISQLITSCK